MILGKSRVNFAQLSQIKKGSKKDKTKIKKENYLDSMSKKGEEQSEYSSKEKVNSLKKFNESKDFDVQESADLSDLLSETNSDSENEKDEK